MYVLDLFLVFAEMWSQKHTNYKKLILVGKKLDFCTVKTIFTIEDTNMHFKHVFWFVCFYERTIYVQTPTMLRESATHSSRLWKSLPVEPGCSLQLHAGLRAVFFVSVCLGVVRVVLSH